MSSAQALGRRAATGAAYLAARNSITLGLGLAAGVVFARLLTPRELGEVAAGGAVLGFAALLSDGGIGAALIRSPEQPSRDVIRAAFGVQALAASALGAVIALVGLQFGTPGQLAALMSVALPLTAARTYALILLERDLNFRAIARGESIEMIAYYCWTVGTVAAGFGVWGLASGAITRAVVGSLCLVAQAGAYHRPRFTLQPIRPYLAFGLRLLGQNLSYLLRDQVLVVGTAGLGGFALAGRWNLARRVLDLPLSLLSALARVSYPTYARLAGSENQPSTEKSLLAATEAVAVLLALILTPLAASAHAIIPLVFGSRWSPSAVVIPFACAAIMVVGPLAATSSGFLWAGGDAKAPLRAAWVHSVVWIAISLPLIRVVGLRAVGIGWLLSSIVEAGILSRATAKLTDNRVGPLQLFEAEAAPILIGAGAAVAAAAVSKLLGSDLVAATAVSSFLSLALYVIGMIFLRPSATRRVTGLGRLLTSKIADAEIPSPEPPPLP